MRASSHFFLFNTQTTSIPASDAAEFKVACLCNLAFACIKLGSMDEAEEASCQALHMRPANAKALFRRGQARLALGRPIEAASDFSEVCLLEPNNAEATKMLGRAQGGEEPPPPPVGISPQEGESERSKAAEPTTHSSDEALPLAITRGRMMDVKPQPAEAGGDTKQNRVEASRISCAPPSGSSFMVSGWLSSAERKQGGQPRGNDNGSIDIHRRQQNGSADHDRSPVGQPGGVKGAVSVSRLVSQLSLAQKSASIKAHEGPVAAGTAAAALQAEWSRLQAEEYIRVQESLRRWSAGGKSRAEEKPTKKAIVKGKLVDAKGGKVKEKTATKKIDSKTVYGGGSKEVNQTSEWWASLEEEENRVREAFRAKLGVGENTLGKEKETEKKKKKKKKNKSKEHRDKKVVVPPSP